MGTLKIKLGFLLMPFMMVSFYHCSSTKMLRNHAPFEIDEVYYQESNSGTNVYISIKSNPNNIILDSIYFKGKQAKLEQENNLFVGRFTSNIIQKQDIIMSNEPYAEYGNKIPKLPEKSTFALKDNECVVSYKEDNSIKYFKIKNVIQK
ncbi:MAG: hypothetical protein B7Z06_01780 [Flavobacteriales bacterium 32-35-8]|nr:MAG: hypothetical protein B7Z06_01780 [Flavobacteriales bacterium 32-35-8]